MTKTTILCSLNFFLLAIAMGASRSEPQEQDFTYHECKPNSQAFADDPFWASHNMSLECLRSKAMKGNGFHKCSSGQSPNEANSSVLCRRGVSCRRCVDFTIKHIKNRCERYKEAVVWNSACMLRYSSNRSIMTCGEKQAGGEVLKPSCFVNRLESGSDYNSRREDDSTSSSFTIFWRRLPKKFVALIIIGMVFLAVFVVFIMCLCCSFFCSLCFNLEKKGQEGIGGESPDKVDEEAVRKG